MAEVDEKKLRDLVDVYKANLQREFGPQVDDALRDSPDAASREYKEFRDDLKPTHQSIYEKLCAQSEKILKIKPDEKQEKELQESINVCHLAVTPGGVISFSFLAPLAIIFGGSFLFFVLFNSLFFVFAFFFIGLAIIKPLAKVPDYMANLWRLKASNQMVLCIFYLVTYMRHTPNLENAIIFAGDHLSPPLSLDMKRLIWSVETEEYPSLKEAIDAYLETWKKYNGEFVEAFHLIESSLYEGEEGRRLSTLDKALDVILEETYEKMLHYAHNLQSPITILHMLGVIMPILGLVILPLVVSFTESAKWYHIAFLYNVFLPFIVYYMGKNILSKRPTGYGDTDISEDNPELQKYKNILIKLGSKELQLTPWIIGITVFSVLFLIGITPLLFFYLGLPDFAVLPGIFGEDENSACGGKFCFLDYKEAKSSGEIIGPFGLGAALISLLVPLSFGMLFGIYFKLKSKNVIQMRERAKKLELEFAGALFQLGNRLGDNLPVEIAVEKVSTTMEGTVSGNFFHVVMMNQRQQGMGIEQSIFDRKHGAMTQFPSALIESSMKVLTQSIKKGPLVAAQALTNVSRYIKEIHKVNERLKDIMADVISSMKSQVKFLAPAIAGVVIGITSMVTTILSKLGQQLQSVTENTGVAGGGAPTGLLDIFGDGVPTYHFQIIVGLYVVQLVYILTIMANGIENGTDKLNEEYQLGQNMIKSTMLYCMIALFVMLTFNMIAGKILTVAI